MLLQCYCNVIARPLREKEATTPMSSAEPKDTKQLSTAIKSSSSGSVKGEAGQKMKGDVRRMFGGHWVDIGWNKE